uniref:Ku domain-containing protein n=1 Tax=Steinernema glaseri TaxID=37863 RepID=A0A1I7Y909_9BILA
MSKAGRVVIFVVDVSPGMSQISEGTQEKGIDLAKNVIRLVVSANLFTGSNDSFGIVQTCRSPDGDGICRRELEGASVDILKYVDREIGEPDADTPLEDRLGCFRQALDMITEMDSRGSEKTIIYLSNESTCLSPKEIDPFLMECDQQECQFVVVGKPNTIDAPEQLQYCWLSFKDASSGVSHFKGKKIAARNMACPLIIGGSSNHLINVNMLIKHQIAKPNLKMEHVRGLDGEKLKKVRQDGATMTNHFADGEDDEQEEPQKSWAPRETKSIQYEAKETARGIMYGCQQVVLNADDWAQVQRQEEGVSRSLRLVMFAPRSDVFPEQIMKGSLYYVLPKSGDANHVLAFSTFVDALLETEKVAIVNYSYNIKSKPKLAALIPKLSKKGCRLCYMVYLPFYQDVRSVEFPSLKDLDISEYQRDTMKSFVHSMALTEGDYKSKAIVNPMIQKTYRTLLHAALSDDIAPQADYSDLLAQVSPNQTMVDKCREIVEVLTKQFPVEKIEKTVSGSRTQDADPLNWDNLLDEDADQMMIRKIEDDQAAAPLRNIKFESPFVYSMLVKKELEEDGIRAMEETVAHLETVISTAIEFGGDQQHERAREFLKEWRKNSIHFKCPAMYNKFFKKTVLQARDNETTRSFLKYVCKKENITQNGDFIQMLMISEKQCPTAGALLKEEEDALKVLICDIIMEGDSKDFKGSEQTGQAEDEEWAEDL